MLVTFTVATSDVLLFLLQLQLQLLLLFWFCNSASLFAILVTSWSLKIPVLLLLDWLHLQTHLQQLLFCSLHLLKKNSAIIAVIKASIVYAIVYIKKVASKAANATIKYIAKNVMAVKNGFISIF